jgi:hypothetical protein
VIGGGITQLAQFTVGDTTYRVGYSRPPQRIVRLGRGAGNTDVVNDSGLKLSVYANCGAAPVAYGWVTSRATRVVYHPRNGAPVTLSLYRLPVPGAQAFAGVVPSTPGLATVTAYDAAGAVIAQDAHPCT